MKVRKARLLCKACFTVLLLSMGITAQTASAADEQKAQTIPVAVHAAADPAQDQAQDVVRRQLDAIRARNADLAFSLTTAHFHERYKDAGKFLDNMRFAHRPLYNHTTAAFLDRHDVEDGVLQKVSLKGSGGAPVTAVFHLKKTGDGQLLIDSFTVLDFSAGDEDGKSI